MCRGDYQNTTPLTGTTSRVFFVKLALRAVTLLLLAGCASSSRNTGEAASDGGTRDAAVRDVTQPDAATARVVPWCVYPPLGGAPPASVAEFASSLESALCARLVRCGELSPDRATVCGVAVAKRQSFTTLASEALAGHVGIDPDGAKACLDAVAQATCDKAATYCFGGQQSGEAAVGPIAETDAFGPNLSWQGPSCDHALRPLVALGDACNEDFACMGGYCANQAGRPGICLPFVPVGMPCSIPRECTSGECDPSLAPLPDGAVNGIGFACAEPPPRGPSAACDYPNCTGVPCRSCDLDLYCAPPAQTNVPVGAVTGTCLSPGDLGTPCSGWLTELDCKPGLYCGPDGKCSARLAAGASCTAPYACQDGLWCKGLTLAAQTKAGPIEATTPGTCVVPAAAGGAACDPSGAYPALNALGSEGCFMFGASCDAATATCVDDPGPGDSCQVMQGPVCDPLTAPLQSCQCPVVTNGSCGNVGTCR